jgi:hypothetical protein
MAANSLPVTPASRYARQTVGNQLLYVYLDGRFHSLGDIHGWAVPSPDGRRVAFLNTIVATNARLIEGR